MPDNKKKFLSTYDLVLSAVAAALITICSWISIPIGEVPFTLQTLAIFTVLFVIGGKRGTIAIVVYLLLGLVGVPVFAGFSGGFAKLAGPTGGFLVGFIFVGLLSWLFTDVLFKKFMSDAKKRFALNIVVALICEVVLYVFGVIWFIVIYTQNEPVALATVMGWCVIPFIIPDIVKFVVANLISIRIYPLIKK